MIEILLETVLTFWRCQLTARVQGERLTVLIFSKLGGETTEKQTRKTSVWGYERGRRRLLVSFYPLSLNRHQYESSGADPRSFAMKDNGSLRPSP
jgi:hypothetical protein